MTMMKLAHPIAIALLAVVLPWGSGAEAATTTSPKIIISNMTGQEIPLESGSVVEVLSNGDLSVRCRLDADSNCASIGAPPDDGTDGGGDPPTASLTASTTSLTAGGPFTLTWSSSGDACYATGPSGIANWSGRALPASGSQSLSLLEGSYTFSLRCYSAGGNREVQSPKVAVAAPIVAAGYCSEYYGPVFPVPSTPDFKAFGFEKVEYTFRQVWGVDPGQQAPKKGVPGSFVNPAMLSSGQGRYMAVAFDLKSVDSSFMSQIRLTWVEAQAVGTPTGRITLTVSPCPGDFRAPISPALTTDPYATTACRVRASNISGNITIATIGSGLSGCPVPANKLMYLNIATYDVYGSATTAPTATTCPTGEPHCGVAMKNE